ncbi:lytic polysaccharide monooxygenase auxiliary activity family 9 protein [Enterococcus villorum]|uniref:Chitin-binding protein n=2 Tax=Enterococcus villorum TaxID=112904 RepID=A0A511J6B8_9ENTE|nr:lytic polysaccharide monooxygenase [Enterococcus villorum]EOH92329.1 hypothetical protein UAO_00482 [Enterococcus villorum ATCC 700913]EOW75698.1 hypothetical protein I591_02791 [Enterococcus villorum ATCC 700913]GEL93253.1 chitin-binding protein [Enterococcus villorum]
MKKNLLLGLGVILGVTGLTALSTVDVSAHGFVESPISRAYQGNLDKEINENAALLKYGPIIYEPSSLEAPKGFPEAGPADGMIASANGVKGTELDVQKSDYWVKQNITTGPTPFTWNYTAAHATAKWHYYITKNGWDQNKKLTRDELQFIGEVQGYGQTADKMPLTQTINIPSDHIGYHVILAVWDIYDTSNAFYNVIDVNIQPRTALTDLATH